MNKVVIVNCFFGKDWPDFFYSFLQSCQYNKFCDFLIFSNIRELPLYIDNVKLIVINEECFKKIVASKLDIYINFDLGYKLCDFKPAYGKIFENYINSYDFWGYCDIDIVFGDFSSFLEREIMNGYNVISAKSQYASGFLMIFKNTSQINNLFSSSADFKEVLSSARHYCFDETNFIFGELLKDGILNIETEIESFSVVLERASKNGRIKYLKIDICEEFNDPDIVLEWNKGILTNVKDNKNILLAHLIEIKRNKDFTIFFGKKEKVFYIGRKGIVTSGLKSKLGWRCKRMKIFFSSYYFIFKILLFYFYSRVLEFTNQTQRVFLQRECCYHLGNSLIRFVPQRRHRYIILSSSINGDILVESSVIVLIKNDLFYSSNKGRKVLVKCCNIKYNIPHKIIITNIISKHSETAYLSN